MNAELSYIGKRLPSISAREKVVGAAKYSVDIAVPGMLVGKYLGSPHAHARIRSVDTSAAERLPGVAAVLTWKDIPHRQFNPSIQKFGLHHQDMYIISEKARFLGDIIAAVAAVDEATAEEALKLIKFDYEVLPAAFSLYDAIKPGAAPVHDFAPNNVSQELDAPGNRGDVKAVFEQADTTVEITVASSRQIMNALEPLTCIAAFDVNGGLTLWTNNQRPMIHRKAIAGLFDMPEAKINVICEYAGGSFGEGNFPIVPVCVALARKAQKPVRVEFTREEFTRLTPAREVYVATGKMGFKSDGTLLAGSQSLLVDSGAYFNRSNATCMASFGTFSGMYRMPAVRGRLKAIYSNTPASGGSRGYGGPEALLLTEQLMDMAAEKLGLDPVELRLKNVKKMGERALQMPMETETLNKVIQLGAEKIGWKEKRSRNKENGTKRRGIGMSSYQDVSGAQPFDVMDRHCVMSLEEDGSVTVTLSWADCGTNLLGSCAQVAAEASGLRFEDFRFVHSATRGARYDMGMGANAGMYGMGNLFAQAGKTLRKEILGHAAKQMGEPADLLDIKESEIFVLSNKSKRVSVRELAETAIYTHDTPSRHITIESEFHPVLNPSATGAVFVDLQVDVETGEIKIDKLVIVHDCGRAINPMTVEGQLEGGVACGLGYALYEDLSINPNTGAVEGNNFNRYKLPSTLDMPNLDVNLFEEPCQSGPFGAKAVGMSGTIGVPAAIANAIYDAVGVRLNAMPFTSERIVAALKEKQAAG